MKSFRIFCTVVSLLAIIISNAVADIRIIKAGGGTVDPAIGLNATDIALDSYAHRVDLNENIYIAEDDYDNNTLIGRGFIRINPWGKVDRVFIDPAFSSYVDDISVDGAGNVFLAVHGYDIFTNGIYKVAPGGEITFCITVPERVESVSVDMEGNMFVGTYGGGDDKIYKADGKTCGGNPVELYSQSSGVDALYADGWGNLYFSTGNLDYRIKKITPQGSVVDIAGNGTEGHSGDGGAATAAQLGSVRGMTGDRWGNIYFSEYSYSDGNYYLRKINSSGVISTIPVMTQLAGNSDHSRLSTDNDGMVYVTGYPNKVEKLVFTPNLASLSLTTGGVGEKVILSGRYFGSRGTGGTVTFNGLGAPVLHWSNEAIICTVPQGATTGNVVVTTPDGQQSNGISFKVR